MEYKTINCPHCGKEMPVPPDVDSFSCMYCNQSISLVAPTNIEASLLDCYFDASDYISKMNYKDYKSAFADYYKKCIRKFSDIDACVAYDPDFAKRDATALIDKIIEIRSEESVGKKKFEKSQIESRDPMFIALYMIPALLATRLPNSQKIAETIRDTWNSRFPKAKIAIGTYDTISAGFKRKFFGLCFITTAVCEFYGKPDDCEELTVLREFRDTYMASTARGRALIKEYYECAPQIVVLIDLCCDREQVYTDLYNRYILPCIQMIHEGRLEDCLNHYCDMVNELKHRFAMAA